MIKAEPCIPNDFFSTPAVDQRVLPRVVEGCCTNCRTKVAINLRSVQELNVSETLDGKKVVLKTCAVCANIIVIPVSFRL